MSALTDGTPRTADPGVLRDRCVLANGRYGVLLSGDGAGFSWFDRLALTPWNGGPLDRGAGVRFYLRDPDQPGFTLLGDRPGETSPGRFEYHREPGRAAITGWIGELEAISETCVPLQTGADCGLELRRLRLRNHSGRARTLEITSYGEVVLHRPDAHHAHPAFSRLFVRSEFVPERRALLFRRRVRDSGESYPWLIHAVLSADAVQHETDRMRFLGRGRDVFRPAALRPQTVLAETTGDVLDPVFALRVRVTIGPDAIAERTFLSGVAADRQAALTLTDLGPGDTAAAVENRFVAAAREDEHRWRDLGLAAARAYELERLAAAILCGDPGVRPDAAILRRLRGREREVQSGCLKPRKVYVVSGPSPAVLAADPALGAPGQSRMRDPQAFDMSPEAAPIAARFFKALGLPIDVWVVDPDGGLRCL